MSDKDAKIRQTYADNVEAKSGKTLANLGELARQQGLVKHSAVVAWLKTEFGLGHGHANYAAHVILRPAEEPTNVVDGVDALFTGGKATWRTTYDTLMDAIRKFGAVEVSSTKTYISLLCRGKKFAIVQPSTERFDIGIKLKGVAPIGRLETAGSWNTMVTHRVRIGDAEQIDAEVLAWLKQAHDAT